MKTFTEPLLEEFDYQLPSELIAYHPLPERDSSRMLVLDRSNGSCEIRKFGDIAEFLHSGDCVVINESKVVKARIFGAPQEAPEKDTEFFLLESLDGEKRKWSALCKPARNIKKFKKFLAIAPENKKLPALRFSAKKNDSGFEVDFSAEDMSTLEKLLDEYGHVPLPPYIKRPDQDSDKERYQTVYAKNYGSVAAPTAGLHFTEDTFAKFAKAGVEVAKLTLHVGAGTFRPVREGKLSEHKMHSEKFFISGEAAGKINNAKKNGGKILSVGTTSLRALESSKSADGTIIPSEGRTSIFIYPPYQITSADMLITNFHLPKSTLLMLVCAFAGTDKILNAYKIAIKEKLRFYSYGDCMLIK
ncbi:MAG TPA: tRNA preQ1(34) S-adenosylmethionine ribosyltransferase-isomerase QueA [Victivallales bacterium]|nr:tRNA preQ1(34) S-adenosylmethionine ribosyltransferase-isomerase QueA [Victivallales bacterium]